MPRGFLKHHSHEIGRKCARGGASRNQCKIGARKKKEEKLKWRDAYKANMYDDISDKNFEWFSDDDEELPTDCLGTCTGAKKECTNTNTEMKECPICLEQRPVIKLLQSCWHESACYDCLRRMLVTDAQKDIKNYPLRCFHPQCRLPVQDGRLRKLKLVQSEQEMTEHYRMTVLGKKHLAGDSSRTLLCPHCSHPRIIRSKMCQGDKDQLLNCKRCSKRFTFIPMIATIRAVEAFGCDDMGQNNGWARCPSCNIIISKGDDFYEGEFVECFCGCEFDWAKTRERFEKYPVAYPPYEELYLWW